MRDFWARQGLVFGIALRNLSSHGTRSLLVGSILALGTTLVLLGLALLDSIEDSTEASITESMAGELQVYSKEGRDDLALFGSGFMGIDEIGRIERVDRAVAAVSTVEGVKAAVPMGIDFATITRDGELEGTLAELRDAYYADDEAEAEVLIGQVKDLVQGVVDELRRRREIVDDPAELDASIAEAERALDEAFWAEYAQDPLAGLEQLDTKVAPLATEGELIFLRYVGTDIPAFIENFERFELLQGEHVPSLTRGLMMNQKFYEQRIKHEVARYFDRVHRMALEQEISIEADGLLRTIARRMPTQWRRVAQQLDAEERARLKAELSAYLPEVEPRLEALLPALLTVSDENVQERYDWFYEHVAPLIDLYAIDVGDTVTIRAYTRSGFLKAINVKMYGVFRFRGLDESDLAGGHNLMDLMTFRELYGLMTPAKARELDRIRDKAGVQDVERSTAEESLFASSETVVIETGPELEGLGGFDEFEDVDFESLRDRSGRVFDASFSREDLAQGMALNMAVVLDDGVEMSGARRRVQVALDEAGLALQVVSWQEASGLVGQFIIVIRLVLYIALAIIFAAALVIINNSTVTATLERIPEIGTLRAIGAQRGTILFMFMTETLSMSLVAGLFGAAVGAGILLVLAQTGIPAWHQVLFFLFGGPRLFPSFGVRHVLWSIASVAAVATISSIYPAWLAARVQPVEAMQDGD
ncbi:MAG: ABC transporter permease [Myxococcota bacterium]